MAPRILRGVIAAVIGLAADRFGRGDKLDFR
jgi:hypothetical protein